MKSENPVQHLVWKKKRGIRIEFWGWKGTRWYWHKMVNGKVTQSGNYATRRSCRRALRTMFGEPDVTS